MYKQDFYFGIYVMVNSQEIPVSCTHFHILHVVYLLWLSNQCYIYVNGVLLMMIFMLQGRNTDVIVFEIKSLKFLHVMHVAYL